MRKIHSHYDNLTVSRNASPEVIRAAYRVLCQKYHPDKHNQNFEYVRIMAIINASYQVLMDPQQRQQHDLWLDEQERLFNQNPKERPHPTKENTTDKPSSSPSVEPEKSINPDDNRFAKKLAISFGLVLFAATVYVIYNSSQSTSSYQPSYYQGNQTAKTTSPQQNPYMQPSGAAYIQPSNRSRPLSAPNGLAWPKKAGYLAGYAVKNNSGLSNITINNQHGSSDIYLKLIHISGTTARHLYIPKGKSFTMRRVSQGAYTLKYKQLDSGYVYKADSILQIDEIPTAYGTRFTNFEYTLYPVADGNTTQTRLNEEDF